MNLSTLSFLRYFQVILSLFFCQSKLKISSTKFETETFLFIGFIYGIMNQQTGLSLRRMELLFLFLKKKINCFEKS